MGLILQRQRRAIESLRGFAQGESISPGRGYRFLLSHEADLVVAGTSVGIGTCSDVFGMNVLVLVKVDDSAYAGVRARNTVEHQCEYAVLLEDATVFDRFGSEVGDGTALETVELLHVRVRASRGYYMDRTGRRASYVPLI